MFVCVSDTQTSLAKKTRRWTVLLGYKVREGSGVSTELQDAGYHRSVTQGRITQRLKQQLTECLFELPLLISSL